MKEIFGIPLVESEQAGESLYLMPQVHPVVYIPTRGFSFFEMQHAVGDAIAEAYTQAAKRGEVGVIKNVKQ